jgi:hypothetical protein
MIPLFQRAAFGVALAVSLLLATPSEACGPDCSEPKPQDDVAACAEGKLGDLTRHGAQCRTLGFLLMRGLSAADRQLIVSWVSPEVRYPGTHTETWTQARGIAMAYVGSPRGGACRHPSGHAEGLG